MASAWLHTACFAGFDGTIGAPAAGDYLRRRYERWFWCGRNMTWIDLRLPAIRAPPQANQTVASAPFFPPSFPSGDSQGDA
jgi:hypothetical protein